jgi:hypothetical protein
MRKCFDRQRQPTPLEHIFRDYDEGPAWSRDLAYQEFGKLFVAEGMDKGLFEQQYGEERKARELQTAEELKRADFSIHFHTWTIDSMLAMFCQMKERYNLAFEFRLVLQNQDEVIFIFQKTVPYIKTP